MSEAETPEGENHQSIFDDFLVDTAIKEEVQKEEEKKKKDVFYYISKINIFFYGLNIFLMIFMSLSLVYVQAQKSEDAEFFFLFEPLCYVFLWNTDPLWWNCSSVTYTLAEYKNKLEQDKIRVTEKLFPLLIQSYTLENILSSEKISFLASKSDSRSRPLEIIEHFDALQSAYVPIDKLELQCKNLTVDDKAYLSLDCEVYSSDWDQNIWFLDEGILRTNITWGTSISKASAFIQYIESSPQSNFRVVEKPKIFTSDDVQFWPYTRKTSFRMVLEYKKIPPLLY